MLNTEILNIYYSAAAGQGKIIHSLFCAIFPCLLTVSCLPACQPHLKSVFSDMPFVMNPFSQLHPPARMPVTSLHFMVILLGMHSAFSRPKLSGSERNICLSSQHPAPSHKPRRCRALSPLISLYNLHSTVDIPQSYWTEACFNTFHSEFSIRGWLNLR